MPMNQIWYPNIYSKNQFEQVTMRFSVTREGNADFKENAGEAVIFAYLPEGHRPDRMSPFSGLIRQIGTDRRCIAAYFAVQVDGGVYAFIPNDIESGLVLVGETTFIAS